MRASIPKTVCLAAVCGLAAVALSASAAGFSETRSFSADSLTVTNLIGAVRIVGHDGSDFKVVADIRGDDASRDAVELDTTSRALTVVFPDSKRYVYPELDADHTVRFRRGGNTESWLGALLGNSTVKVERRGSGLEIWADLEIHVPEGGSLQLRHGAGAIVVENVAGAVDLDGHYGKVTVGSIDGDLLVDTGSGDVNVVGVRGDVSIDTGSGDVDASGVRGEKVWVDTGSGDVSLTDVATAGDVLIDTGSGAVSLRDVSGARFDIDTGSGNVDARGVRADSARIDTGSGTVAFFLAEMGRGDFDIDTGSGGITLALPANAGCSVDVDSGSGGVRIDVADVQGMRRHGENEVEFSVGDGASRVSLESGSGAIRIVESH